MSDLLALPFVRRGRDNLNMWGVKPTGDWTRDNETGRRYAQAFVAFGEPALLPHIVKAMEKGARIGMERGIEIGFLHRLAERALAA